MKGVIFNLLEETVTIAHGAPAWESLLAVAGLDGSYTSLGSYPDAEIVALVEAASAALALPAHEVLRWFGRSAMPLLHERYQDFFAPHRSARTFLASVNDIIHPEVRKLYSGAACPHFHVHELDDGRMGMAYQSPRQMCWLAHGFIEGAADHFGDTVEIEHLSCMLARSPVCRLALRWTP